MQENSIIMQSVWRYLREIAMSDRKNMYYLLYYSMIEALLLTVIPLTSAFIINSVLAHATISIVALSVIVIVVFVLIVLLQILKASMIEKFEQQIFVKNAIAVADLAVNKKERLDPQTVDRYMNYFFDVVAIQKLFPVLLLNGSALIVKVAVSLVLLLIFDISFFTLGIFFILFFGIVVLFLGRKGARAAIERSDAKHEAIYFLQGIPEMKERMASEKIFETLDAMLMRFVRAREGMFAIILRQLSLTYIMEGIILSTFFIVGGYLVFEGMVPIGEFVAAEIIIISVTYALRDFMKQVDYMYDMIEGFYKINKLTDKLGNV